MTTWSNVANEIFLKNVWRKINFGFDQLEIEIPNLAKSQFLTDFCKIDELKVKLRTKGVDLSIFQFFDFF